MAGTDRNSVIDQWLSDQFGDEGRLLLSIGQLQALTLASTRRDPPQFSDEVLTAWRQAIVRQRLVVNQSEIAFMEQARAHGQTWQDIAENLGLPSSEAAERRLKALKEEVARTHPGANPQPYLP